MRISSVKPLNGENHLDFLPPQQYYITYLTRGKYPIIDSPQLNFQFHPMGF